MDRQRTERGNRFKGTVGQKERFKDQRHDVYRERQKWPEPTRCTECGAVFTKGRWSWEQAPGKAQEAVCPACRRIADGYPAGFVEIRGPFFGEHREEIVHLLRNVETQEKGEHPLERIMGMQEEDGRTVVTTTGIHLARRLGSALSQAYKGQLSLQYGEAEEHVRVLWER